MGERKVDMFKNEVTKKGFKIIKFYFKSLQNYKKRCYFKEQLKESQ